MVWNSTKDSYALSFQMFWQKFTKSVTTKKYWKKKWQSWLYGWHNIIIIIFPNSRTFQDLLKKSKYLIQGLYKTATEIQHLFKIVRTMWSRLEAKFWQHSPYGWATLRTSPKKPQFALAQIDLTLAPGGKRASANFHPWSGQDTIPAAVFDCFCLWSFWSSSILPRLVCLAYVRGFYILLYPALCCDLLCRCCVVSVDLHCVVFRCDPLCCAALCCVALLTSSAFLVFRLC